MHDLAIAAAEVKMNKFVTCSHKGAIAYLFDQTEERI